VGSIPIARSTLLRDSQRALAYASARPHFVWKTEPFRFDVRGCALRPDVVSDAADVGQRRSVGRADLGATAQ